MEAQMMTHLLANLNFSLDINSFTCDDLGQNTVTLSVADFDNNIGTATAIVTVEDNIAPAIAVQDISLSLDVNGGFEVSLVRSLIMEYR